MAINQADLNIIKQLQTALNKEIPKKDEIGWSTVGYTTDSEGRVNGLSLHECGVTSQHLQLIGNLTKLQTLNLRSNQINKIENLEKLTNLQELFLYSNQISDTTSIRDLLLKQKQEGKKVLEVSSSIGWRNGK